MSIYSIAKCRKISKKTIIKKYFFPAKKINMTINQCPEILHNVTIKFSNKIKIL